jgi:outer membrane receptor protein involved in Fe transport
VRRRDSVHPAVRTKFSGNNFGLRPEHDFGWDIGVRQELWQNRFAAGLTYFHNDLSNAIGSNGLFQTLNLGAAETQGLEAELRAQPIANLLFSAAYTYLEAEKPTTPTFRNRRARVCRADRGT